MNQTKKNEQVGHLTYSLNYFSFFKVENVLENTLLYDLRIIILAHSSLCHWDWIQGLTHAWQALCHKTAYSAPSTFYLDTGSHSRAQVDLESLILLSQLPKYLGIIGCTGRRVRTLTLRLDHVTSWDPIVCWTEAILG